MKTNHCLALLKLEALFYARFLFFPIVFAAEIVVFSAIRQLDGAMLVALLMLFGCIVIFWSYGFIFQDGTMGFRCGEQRRALRTLEFPFSRAFDRRTLFGARSLMFFFSVSIPLVTFVVASLWHPDRTIEINRGAGSPSPAIQAYYLAHFPGAMLQTADATPNLPSHPGSVPQPHNFKKSIVLPRAQTELAVTTLWVGVIGAALYQAMMLGTLRFKWLQRLLPIGLGVLAPGAVMAINAVQIIRAAKQHLGNDRLPVLDRAQAWAIQNSLVFLLIGAVIIGLALRFSRRRFVRQEALA
ncbi:MAG: hypothetical protein ABSA05_03295 [Opitutaceae bacterium]|jgi:hypothetical protein